MLDERDREILALLATGSQIGDIVQRVPKATFYRRLDRLLKMGLLAKQKNGYRLTAAGYKVLHNTTTGLAHVYPLLAELPTAEHLAKVELALAAISARLSGLFQDHLPGFLIVGPTMSWKTSLGKFLCLILDLDPALHIVDCSSETGKSLWLRRDSRGRTVFKRELLDAPFVCFDEYGWSDKVVRVSVQHFIAGRLRVPLENKTLDFRCTPLLTMNPVKEGDIEAKTGLKEPQIRRLVICDLESVKMPDLAVEGETLLERAAKAPPFPLRTSTETLSELRPRIVGLCRRLLTEPAQRLVDMELVRVLVCGMRPYMQPDEALRRVMVNLCCLWQTLGWTAENWRDILEQEFDKKENRKREVLVEEKPMRTQTDRLEEALTYLSVDTGRKGEGVLGLLVDLWRAMRGCGLDTEGLKQVVEVLDAAAAKRVEPQRLRDYLTLERHLAEHNLSPQELGKLGEALKRCGMLEARYLKALITLLEVIQRNDVDLPLLRQAATLLARAKRRGLPLHLVQDVLETAAILHHSGIDVRRGLARLTEAALSAETSRIEVERLRREEADLRQRVKRLQTELERLGDLYKTAWRRLLDALDKATGLAKEAKRLNKECRRLQATRDWLLAECHRLDDYCSRS